MKTALKWKADKPKRCGWYWVAAKGHPVQLRRFTDTPLTELREGEHPLQPNDGPLSTEGWECFAGPLPEAPPAPIATAELSAKESEAHAWTHADETAHIAEGEAIAEENMPEEIG